MPLGKHGLGKGISSLIGDYDVSTFEVEKLVETGSKVVDIDISKIKPNPNQPRKTFDPESLNELSRSILNQGVIVPLIVESISDDTYSIIAGERRYRASKLAGLRTVPCIVRSFSDMQRMEVSLIENIQRENLNPVEEAKAYSYLLTQQGIKQEELAEKLGKSRSTVTNSLRLLNLPSQMLDSLQRGDFTPGHARALLSVNNPAEREILYVSILKDALSVRQAEAQAISLNKGLRAKPFDPNQEEKPVKEKNAEISEVEEKFLSSSGCRIVIKGSLKKGKIVIPFTKTDELERIYEIFSKGEKLFDSEDDE